MKKNIIILLTILTFSSCNKEDPFTRNEVTGNEFIGKWRLIEQLADPGDGSGVFTSVASEKILEFFDNGIVTSTNGSLCNPYSEEQITSGTFSLVENKITTNCQDSNIATIGIELKDKHLILSFLSIEGFYQKFQRVH